MNSLAATFSGICVLRNVYQGFARQCPAFQAAILYCFHFVFRCHIGQNKNVNGCIAGWAVRGLDRQEGIFGLISPATLILFLY